jgi:DNA polymerase III delta prime subunit
MSNLHQLWVDKYRPKTIDEYVFQDDTQKQQVTQWVVSKTIPNLLFLGTPGTGKSSLARLLINATGVDPIDVLELNASRDGTIDTIRTKITDFVSATPMGDWKIVFLDEADRMSLDGQKALRHLMEEHTDYVRFILTGNHGHRIEPALKSRCQEFTFQAVTKEYAMLHVGKILMVEGVEFDLDTLEYYIDAFYPDIRKTVNTVEMFSVNGKLARKSVSTDSAWETTALRALETSDLNDLRSAICGTVTQGEWENVYTFLYNNIHRCPLFQEGSSQWDAAIVTIAKYLYTHAFVADPELNAAAMCIQLKLDSK